MGKQNPKYSVLMTVYKNDNPVWLKQAIDSMLAQTIFPDEFIIIIDGPISDDLKTVLTQYDASNPNLFIFYHFEENQTLGPALKKGVELCSNDLIARMDADDFSVPERVVKQIEVFEKYPDISIVGSNVDEFYECITNAVSRVVLPETHEEIVKYSKSRCPFRHSAILYRKTDVLKAGNYRKFFLCEDYDLYTRMIRNGSRCFNIQEPLTFVRINPDFYKRRGGTAYLRSILKFKKEQYETGYFSFFQYIKSSIPHIIICLMPNAMRVYLYQNFLRKKVE